MNTIDSVLKHAEEFGASRVLEDGRAPRLRLPSGEVAPLLLRSVGRGEVRLAEWEQIASRQPGTIVVHEFINRMMSERYRSIGVPHIDAVGNAWLRVGGLHVWVEGRRPHGTAPHRSSSPRAFTPAGVRVTFALLVDSDLTDAAVRDVADASGASTGAAQGALGSLRDLGYLQPGGGRLMHRDRLIAEWVTAYLNRLAPKLRNRQMVGPTPEWWAKQSDVGGTIAGEAAVSELILPTTTTIFGSPPWVDITRIGRLRRATEERPNVLLVERFWNEEALATGVTAPLLLTYATLLASGDDRQREAAQKVLARGV